MQKKCELSVGKCFVFFLADMVLNTLMIAKAPSPLHGLYVMCVTAYTVQLLCAALLKLDNSNGTSNYNQNLKSHALSDLMKHAVN